MSEKKEENVFYKSRKYKAFNDGQVVLYKGEVVQVFLEPSSPGFCTIVFVKKIENNILDPSYSHKKNLSGLTPLQIRSINNQLNELEIEELLKKFYEDNQVPADITNKLIFDKLNHTKGNTKVVMNSERNLELVQKLLKNKEETKSKIITKYLKFDFNKKKNPKPPFVEIANSFQIQDNSWEDDSDVKETTECQTSPECPVLFSEINKDGQFSRKKTGKDSFTLYISIVVPKNSTDLDKRVHSNECTYLRTVQIDGTCYLNATLNALIMSLPLRQLIFEEEERMVNSGMKCMTIKEMQQTWEPDSYSSEIVKKYFFSLICHLKRNGRIQDNDPVINNMALQIKKNYYTIYGKYPYSKIDIFDKNSLKDKSFNGGNSFLSLLEIIKTFNFNV